MIDFPSDAKDTLIEVFYLVDHDPFICGANGRIGTIMIEEIEEQLLEDGLDFFDKGTGTYLYRANWIEPQTNEEGRVELSGYWYLDFVAFKQIGTS